MKLLADNFYIGCIFEMIIVWIYWAKSVSLQKGLDSISMYQAGLDTLCLICHLCSHFKSCLEGGRVRRKERRKKRGSERGRREGGNGLPLSEAWGENTNWFPLSGTL
jgi:hypothetical protein